jgi:hypothetical protein
MEDNSRRQEFIEKFERNFSLIQDFKIFYSNFLDKTGTWEKVAFPDSKITNRQYYITLCQVSDAEYTLQQRQAIKTVFIHENVLPEYSQNLDSQFQNMKLLYEDIKQKVYLLK